MFWYVISKFLICLIWFLVRDLDIFLKIDFKCFGIILFEDWLMILEIFWIEFIVCIILLIIFFEFIVCFLKSMIRFLEMFIMGIEYDDWFVLRI